MKCEICGTQYRRIDSNMVCAQGHTIQNVLEVIDDEDGFVIGKRKTIKALKASVVREITMHKTLANFMIFRCLYYEAMAHLNIKSDIIYKYFTGFFSYKILGENSDELVSELNYSDSEEITNYTLKILSRELQGIHESNKDQSQTDECLSQTKNYLSQTDTCFSQTDNYSSQREPSRNNKPVYYSQQREGTEYAKESQRDIINLKNKVQNQPSQDTQTKPKNIIFKNTPAFPNSLNIVVESSKSTNFFTLCAIIYLSKKAECESKNETYMFSEFKKEMKHFDLHYKIDKIKKIYNLETDDIHIAYPMKVIPSLVHLQKKVQIIANFDTWNSSEQAIKSSDSGIICKYHAEIKLAIRNRMNTDISMLMKYFNKICEVLKIEQSERLIFYFKKFVYCYEYNTIMIPDVEIGLFIVQYYIDAERFQDSGIEKRVLKFLKIHQKKLLGMLCVRYSFYNKCVDPSVFIQEREYKKSIVYSNFKKGKWMVDHYKKGRNLK